MVNGGNGSANSALGGYSLQNHVTGSYNTAIGYEAMQLDSAGGLNVAVGWRALRNNKIGAEKILPSALVLWKPIHPVAGIQQLADMLDF